MKTKTTSKNRKRVILCGCIMVGLSLTATAQVKVGDNPNQIVSGARFQVDGNNTTTVAAKLLIDNVGNVGIGTSAPANMLHVNGTDPLRLSGLQNSATIAGTTSRTIVADANGVLKTKSKDNVSAVRATGSVTLAANNTFYFTDATATPVETFDNLNEFSGHTFKAAQDGLYQVNYTVRYKQVTTAYMGYASLQVGDAASPADYGIFETVQVPAQLAAPVSISVVKSELVKLTAGQVILFRVLDYAAGADNTATYTINVNRID